MLPDGQGGLFLVSPNRVLRLKLGEKPVPYAETGSAAGAVALGPEGSLYLGRHDKVHKVARNGKVTVVAEGFREVFGVAVDAQGTLYVADWTAGKVIRVKDGKKKVVASGLEYPSGLVLDPAGDLFIKESGRQTNKDMRVKKLAADGTLTTFATVPSISRFRAR